MASSNEATPIVSADSRPPTLTRLLATCAPSSWFLPPPHHDRACHSTASRVPADAGTTAYDCVARLGGLKWDSPASPGVRVLSSFFDILEQHPSLLDLFREKVDAISNAPYSEMPRMSEHEVEMSFLRLLFGGLDSATAALLNHYAAITEAVGTSSASASTRYSVQMREPQRALRTQGDAVVYIQRGAGNVVSGISIEYKRDNVHHSLAKPDQAVVDALLDARSQPPNRPRTRSKPDSDSDSDRDDDPSPRVRKGQKTSAEATCAQAEESNRPITPPVSVELQSDLSFDPLTPVTRIFSSPPASTDWTPTISPLSGSCHSSEPITIVEDRGFVIQASLSNAHWSMMSYTGTSRIELVEIGFDIVSSVPSDSPLASRLSSKPSPASDFIRSLHLSDVVLRWLSENPREELEDDRIPLELLDRFEPTADFRLEKEVGTGSTAGGWLAKVVRVNRPLSSSAKAEVPLVDHPAPNARYFLKLMPCVYAGSVIRETLFYQHVFPHLPDHLRKHLPQYHGTYRRTNGNGYAMALENVGTTMNQLDFYGSRQLWEIEAAFRELGIIHNDVSARNVLVRPNNGPFCFVDWGRSYLKL
ncbi:hypothetical protein MVLG_06380 [Microbotryum lychnidis-dioicae p1A1 Lamole]|uniref:Uncharacterized protein n=1 Tax=Microbotryum lychnidis-dioicae (strain p1A1 Lamole / MvSl-1064) TaxID=683840 RepID=U5HH40_USTV1|nr:hypothetical protein MVLG_06380 [Microbotryum lychnidis-dioicae p1A1 Lamole]|eukprot:KDE03119.1 hypothetical protein MVLG_06380 [Microbotryum lychnidis-dioicae p1A1 Lamole]